jgi:hypothetical protein
MIWVAIQTRTFNFLREQGPETLLLAAATQLAALVAFCLD